MKFRLVKTQGSFAQDISIVSGVKGTFLDYLLWQLHKHGENPPLPTHHASSILLYDLFTQQNYVLSSHADGIFRDC